MKKIAIFQANLMVGGIQRSLVNLLKSDFFSEDYDVDVFLFSKEIFYDIDKFKKNIHIKFLNPFPYWYRFVPFELIRKFYKDGLNLSEYDYVVDYDSYRQECAYYVSKAEKANKIMWIHNDMSLEYKYNKKYRVLYHFFKQKYKYYDQFAAVSKGIIDSFMKMSGIKEKKVTVVPNIIDVNEIFEKSKKETDVIIDPEKINIVCVGRIYVAKGYEYLLYDFKYAYKKNKNLRLYIIGEGPDQEKYEVWTKKNDLDSVVYFLGKRENPFSIMKYMDAFCLESRYEGQGMVFMEAKSLGLQLIFPKRLEKYNVNLVGTDDIVNSLINLEKKDKSFDYLDEYHDYIVSELNIIFKY